MSHLPTLPLTQLEFSPADHRAAEKIARRLGYLQTAYTSTSALWGLFCLLENPEHFGTLRHGVPDAHKSEYMAMRGKYPPFRGGCIIKTKELGFLFVQNTEDIGLGVML